MQVCTSLQTDNHASTLSLITTDSMSHVNIVAEGPLASLAATEQIRQRRAQANTPAVLS